MIGTVGEVQVMGLRYTVVEEGNGENVYDDAPDGARIGLCCFFEERIIIHEGLSRERKRRSLAHELCHAYLEATASMRDTWDCEDVCNVMEHFAAPIMAEVNRLYPNEEDA